MAEAWTIRPANRVDQPGMARVERASFSDPWSPRAFDPSAGGIWLVAEDGTGIVGFALGHIAADEGEILNVAVHPDHRRRGAGAGLVRRLVSTLVERGAETIYLDVRESNQEAIALYRKIGFEAYGVRTRYYSKPVENALQMSLKTGP